MAASLPEALKACIVAMVKASAKVEGKQAFPRASHDSQEERRGGLLLAVLGNILGTYLGLVTAVVCRLIAGG